MDAKSIYGYAENSPYRNAPYLDIQTPEGLITMENTPIDLMGIDNLGNVKKMKAKSKNPYKFPGTQVREIPMQTGGNLYRYQMGGKAMFDFLFDDEDEEKPKGQVPTAPTVDEVDIQTQMIDLQTQQKYLADQENENLAMSILMDENVKRTNPYQTRGPQQSGNPYMGEIQSSGQFGDQNVGEFGRQIYGQLVNDLGYAPKANSIFRSKAQNDALIASGVPAVKNSWHLSGNAIDLKPDDWHKLSNEQQFFYRKNYDVVYHNNHYHIEPK